MTQSEQSQSESINRNPIMETSKNNKPTRKLLIIGSVILIIVVFGVAAYFLFNSSFTTSPYSNSSQPTPLEEASREEIFTKLTNNSWCNREATKDSMFPDYTDYQLKPDGTYEWYHFTDYMPAPSGSGKWNFERDSYGEWFLLYDDGQRLRFIMNENGSLILEDSNLDSCDPISTVKKYDASTLPPIQISSSAKLVADKLTANKWKRANDFDLDYKPTLVEFKKNYEYVTIYRNGECQNGGSWYATADEIKGKSLNDKCDPRNDTICKTPR